MQSVAVTAVTFQLLPNQVLAMRVHRPLTEVQATEVCEELLARAHQAGSWRWLLDVRRDGGPKAPDFNLWLLEEFFPRANVELNQQLCVAYLLAPAHLARLRAEEPAGSFLVGALAARVRIRFYVVKARGLGWLQACA